MRIFVRQTNRDMKATAGQIFSRIQGINPNVNTISSIGNYVSNSDQIISDSIHSDCANNVPSESLAYSILRDNVSSVFSEKQIWVIAFELANNEEYALKLGVEIELSTKRTNIKIDAQKFKLKNNKAESQSVLDFVKANKLKLADYYEFVKKSKKFSNEFYSKKFTITSAIEFINK